jgi:hypothetical protein
MGALPLVVAGPILRRVDESQVCVWVALSQPADVTVTVFSGRATSTGSGTADQPSVGQATRTTRKLGANLHVVVVDVPVPGLVPRQRYSYDVAVTAGGTTKGLRDLGLLRTGSGTPAAVPLGYATDMLPGFVTAAADLEELRFAHTSCRKSNGPGPDALAWLDDRIQAGLSDLDKAPQLLFLTGDQVYADDVGGVLLPMLADLGRDLVGPEKLPVAGGLTDATLEHFPALRRQNISRVLGRFTSTDATNHLFSYGEFAAMYCAAFSPAAWRALPDPATVLKPMPADAAQTHATDLEACWDDPDAAKAKQKRDRHSADLAAEAERVRQWRDAVPVVARALANVPTLMICDDHEITDDWNLSARWRSRMVTAPFGRAVVRNGLMAYAAFQAWGNDPATFRHDGQVAEAQRHANEQLLDAVEQYAAGSPTSATLDRIDALLGLDKPDATAKIQFHYQLQGAKFAVRVLDTRTQRGYEGTGYAPPKLLGSTLDKQLPKGPFTDGRELLVVVSAAPVLFPQIFDRLVQPVAATFFDLKANIAGREDETNPCAVPGLVGTEEYDAEGWGADEVAREELFRRLGSYRRVVVLSGDVHFAGSLVLDFWGAGDEQPDSRIVQCTSSAARNQPEPEMRALLRTLRIGQQLLRGVPAERIAWEKDSGVVLPAGAHVRPGRRARMRRKPAVVPAGGWPPGTTTSKPPDWRWRLEVLRDDRPAAQLPAGAPVVPVLTWNAADPVSSYADIAARHQQLTLAPKDPVRLMVFRNNVGLVSFARDGSDYRISHTLLSTADDETGDEYTQHTAAFAPTPAPAVPVLRTE